MGYLNHKTLTSSGDGTPSKEDRYLSRLIYGIHDMFISFKVLSWIRAMLVLIPLSFC
jgi:hypothetical protein